MKTLQQTVDDGHGSQYVPELAALLRRPAVFTP
jgi:hypothetical protein